MRDFPALERQAAAERHVPEMYDSTYWDIFYRHSHPLPLRCPGGAARRLTECRPGARGGVTAFAAFAECRNKGGVGKKDLSVNSSAGRGPAIVYR